MNQKRAKRLRRIARRYTDGVPRVDYRPADEGRAGRRLTPLCTKGFMQGIKRTERRFERARA